MDGNLGKVAFCILFAFPLAAQSDKAITFSPRTVERGETVFVTITNAPSVPLAKVWLGEYRLKDVPLSGAGPIAVTVPADADEGAGKPFPLGAYVIRIELANHTWVTPDPVTVVALHGSAPQISEVVPRFNYLQGKTSSFTIRGSGFGARLPSDNVLVLNGAEQDVVWDGCEPSKWGKGDLSRIHGLVRSPRQIEICNVSTPGSADFAVAIRQGTAEARAPEQIRFTNWSRAWITALAGGVVLGTGGLIILLLALKPGEYRIGNETYGYFRALFLDQETDTYSLSKLQFYLWTGAALFSYAYFALSRLLVQRAFDLPEVPGTLPGIVAIGAGTAVGSQVVSTLRGPKGAGEEKPSLSDLITSGGVVAADRVQLLAWTLLTVFGFCAAVLRQDPSTITALPLIPENLLYLSGLSSLGYLGAKFARKPGPVIDELTVQPAGSDQVVQPAMETPGPPAADFEQPIAAAKRNLLAARAAVGGLSGFTAAAVKQAASTVASLEAGISEASGVAARTAQSSLARLESLSSGARDAAAVAASEFERVAGVTSPEADAARQSAALAQRAAAAIEELSAGVGQAAAAAEAKAAGLRRDAPGFRRVIELRGRNLSAEARFTIAAGETEYELPFRMLEEIQDSRGNRLRVPRIVVPEDQTGTPNMARRLRLTIPRDELDAVDRKSYDAWFGHAGQQQLKFTILNPDGQQAAVDFSMPPAVAWK